jgi:hypothetical protein
MSDIINIDQFETVENIEITVFPTYNEINVNKVTGAVNSVNGQNGDVVLTKTDLNLGNVDNTSDVNKPISNATQTALDLKVDKITGKGLSTNDYTTIEKTKLSGIQDGAEVNVNADWNATTGDALILNKPTIPSLSTLVPYTGATSDLNLGTNNLIADHIALNVSPSGAGFVVGATQWSNTLGSSETLLKGGNVILKNGVDLLARVVNKVVPNTTLTKASYQVVKVSGAIGQRLAVDLAQANTDLNSADTLGIVIETIATNQEGFIMTVGQIEDINTTGSLQGETWLDGDVLYLSPTIAGRVTNIKPTGATGHIVILGYVEHSHANQGKIYVKIMNGWELDELHNVYIDTPLNNQVLTYETSTDLWKNKSVNALGIEETLNKSSNVDTDQASATKYPSVKSLFDWATNLFLTKSFSAFSFRVNNTSATANATETTYRNKGIATYTGGITFSGTTAPSGTTNHSYNWLQIGNLITLNVNLFFSTNGVAITIVNIDLPTDCPTPLIPNGMPNSANVKYYIGSGRMTSGTTANSTTPTVECVLRKNGANNGFIIYMQNAASSTYGLFQVTIQYFT